MSNHSGRMRRARLAICGSCLGGAMPGKLGKVGRDSGCEIFQIQVGKVWCNSTGGETHSGGLALECTFKAPPKATYLLRQAIFANHATSLPFLCEHQWKAVNCHLLPTPNVCHHRSSLIAEAPPPHCAPRTISPSNSDTLFASAARRAGSLLLVQQHCPGSPR